MFTFTRAIWLRCSKPTLWEPAPVSHSLIRAKMSLRNNLISGGGLNTVANAAKLMGTDNAVLSDSSHS
jgi:hypothetical protein